MSAATWLPAAAAALALAGWLHLAWTGRRTERAVPDLGELPPDPAPPSITAVVPCRNEARDVEAAIRSLLAQDLPELEVIAVDDRSEDATGAILDRLAAGDRRLRVHHVTALPEGWLGKTHACEVAGRLARGEWLLFTDGDVVFGADALRRALGFARAHGLGHVVAVPRLVAPGFVERAFVSAFGTVAQAGMRAFELSRPGTRGFVGIGAFNLVRRDAWERVGGHRRLAREVVDDAKLGLLLRRSGVPQGAVNGGERVRVRWQHGARATALGLVKNAFAAVEYRVVVALAAGLWGCLLGLGPVAAALAPHPAARALGLAALALAAWVVGGAARRLAGGSGAEGLLAPAMPPAIGAVLLASAAAAGLRGGVRWRGTFYPLGALRAGGLRIADLPVTGAAGWPAPPRDDAAAALRRAAP